MMRRFLGICLRDVALLLAITVIAGAITKAAHPGAPGWYLQPETDEHAVTRADVRERWKDEVLWIDARSAEVYEAGHQPGALRLAPDEWNALLPDVFEQIASSDRVIVVYCDGKKCGKSKEIANKLRDVGVPEVYHLLGGWAELNGK